MLIIPFYETFFWLLLLLYMYVVSCTLMSQIIRAVCTHTYMYDPCKHYCYYDVYCTYDIKSTVQHSHTVCSHATAHVHTYRYMIYLQCTLLCTHILHIHVHVCIMFMHKNTHTLYMCFNQHTMYICTILINICKQHNHNTRNICYVRMNAYDPRKALHLF